MMNLHEKIAPQDHLTRLHMQPASGKKDQDKRPKRQVCPVHSHTWKLRKKTFCGSHRCTRNGSKTIQHRTTFLTCLSRHKTLLLVSSDETPHAARLSFNAWSLSSISHFSSSEIKLFLMESLIFFSKSLMAFFFSFSERAFWTSILLPAPS